MSRHCLLEGTNILLINGIEKKIEELKVDDELIVYEIKNMKNTQYVGTIGIGTPKLNLKHMLYLF